MKESLEKHQLKITLGVAIVVILFLLGCAVKFGSWTANAESTHNGIYDHVERNEKDITSLQLRVAELEQTNNELKIEIVKIQTKLVNIETLLLEIKEAVREK